MGQFRAKANSRPNSHLRLFYLQLELSLQVSLQFPLTRLRDPTTTATALALPGLTSAAAAATPAALAALTLTIGGALRALDLIVSALQPLVHPSHHLLEALQLRGARIRLKHAVALRHQVLEPALQGKLRVLNLIEVTHRVL